MCHYLTHEQCTTTVMNVTRTHEYPQDVSQIYVVHGLPCPWGPWAVELTNLSPNAPQVSIEIHAERTWMDTLSLSLVPRHIFERHCALLDTALPVSGTITVEAPPSKKVSLFGLCVSLAFELFENISFCTFELS